MKIGVVVPVLRNFQQALDCISSIKSKNHEVKFYIQPQYHYQVPLAAAWNRGFTQAYRDECDYILIVNDDVLLASFSLDDAIEEFSTLDEKYVLYSFKNAKKTYELPLEILYAEDSSDMILEEAEMFSCFLVRCDFFYKCGTFDENFDPCFWEDNDMHYRIHLLGFLCYFSNVPFLHIGNQTTQTLSVQEVLQKGAKYFIEKWGSLNRGAPNWDRSFTKPIVEQFKTPYNDKSLTPKDWK